MMGAILVARRNCVFIILTRDHATDGYCRSDPCVVTLSSFDTQYSAYGAQLAVTTKDGVVFLTTAFDVTKTPGYPIRYGFLSDFDEKSRGVDDVETMAKYHINAVQFYEWSWRHDKILDDTTSIPT